MFVETIFASSFGFSFVLFGAVVALYHVNDVFGVTVNAMSDRSAFACRVELYEVCPPDMYLQLRPFFPHRYKPLD